MTQLDRLVYLTLSYSAYFAYPLTLLEIQQRLVSSDDVEFLFAKKQAKLLKNNFSLQQIRNPAILRSKDFLFRPAGMLAHADLQGSASRPSGRSIRSLEIKNSLKKLIKQGIFQSDGKYFFLNKAHLGARLSKQAYLSEKQEALTELKNAISRIPLIKAAILTGGTAVDNAKRFDDLDVLIVCQSQTLWLVRLWLVLLSKWKNKRPLKNKYAWCFNLFLDENDLEIKAERRSLYEAYEILQMKFFYDPENIQEKLLAANQHWLAKYLLYYRDQKKKRFRKEELFSSLSVIKKLLNQCLFFIQKGYRQLRFGEEDFDLSLTQAFFNKGSFRVKLYVCLTNEVSKFLYF